MICTVSSVFLISPTDGEKITIVFVTVRDVHLVTGGLSSRALPAFFESRESGTKRRSRGSLDGPRRKRYNTTPSRTRVVKRVLHEEDEKTSGLRVRNVILVGRNVRSDDLDR